MRKKDLTLVMAVLIMLGSVFFPKYFPPQPSVLPAHTVAPLTKDISVFAEPESPRAVILDTINNAQQSIDLEIYMLSDDQTIQGLIAAKQSGVRVRVIMEKNPFQSGGINQTTRSTLEKGGVEVMWSNPRFDLTHQKSMIVDNKQVFIMNQNLTKSSFTKNREYNIIDTNPEDIAEVSKIFNADWNRETFIPTNPHLVVSPDTSRAVLTALINNAQKTLDVEMEVIQDNQIEQLLAEKAKTIKVRVIMPTLDKIAANKEAIKILTDAGAEVRLLKTPYLHAKLIISDVRNAYVGSINFTSNSLDKNRELGVILGQEAVVQALEANFMHDWDKALSFSL